MVPGYTLHWIWKMLEDPSDEPGARLPLIEEVSGTENRASIILITQILEEF